MPGGKFRASDRAHWPESLWSWIAKAINNATVGGREVVNPPLLLMWLWLGFPVKASPEVESRSFYFLPGGFGMPRRVEQTLP